LFALLTAHPAVEWIDARAIWPTSAADFGKSA
jgi:hypothetical protein